MSKPYGGQPAATVQQEFAALASGVIQAQTAVFLGPEKLVLLSDDTEDRTFINYGAYVPGEDTEYDYAGLPVGGVIDESSVKLILEDIHAKYATLSGANVIERGGAANQLYIPTAAGFQRYDNGTTVFSRNTNFKNRDVQVGDRVKITVSAVDYETRIIDFINAVVAASVGDPTALTNPATQALSTSVTAIDVKGTNHVCVVNTASTTYKGSPARGVISDTYTLEVTVAGAPATAKFKVTSVDGDNVAEVTTAAFGTSTAIGSRGLRAHFTSSGSQDFVVGEKYTILANTAYLRKAPLLTSAADDYDGLFDTVYKVKVVKGGVWADSPQVAITTSTGLDASGPVVVAHNTSFVVGQLGLTAKFGNVLTSSTTSTDATVTVASTATLTAGMTVVGAGVPAGATILSITNGTDFELSANATATASVSLTYDTPVGGLELGDEYLIAATASKKGAVRTAVVSNPLPDSVAEGDDLSVDFYIYKASQEIDRAGYPEFADEALVVEAESFTVNAGIEITDSSWTDTDGVTLEPLDVAKATVIVPYSALLTSKEGVLRTLSDASSVEVILGKVIPENPLAYAVDKALQNSGGTPVSFVSIGSDDISGYRTALEALEIDPSNYFRQVLSEDAAILDLLAGHIGTEGSDEVGHRCAGFIATKLDPVALKYDKKADGDNYGGYVAIEPGSNPAAYRRARVPGATFLTDGIRAGDEFRTLFSIDALGNTTYRAVQISSVTDEENLILVAPGYSEAVGASDNLQRIQIARNLTKDEQAVQEGLNSSYFKTRRLYNVFPNFPVEVPSYFVAAAVAGLASSVVPHQPITNYNLLGFGDQAGTQVRFTPTQLNKMAEGGTLVVTQSKAGGDIFIRHQLSTDNTDDLQSELSVCRNVDSISSYLKEGLDVFVGKYNITDNFLQMLDVQIRQRLNNLVGNTATLTAGPQIISWDQDSLLITQNPVLRTEVDIEVDAVVPMPANKIRLKLRISA